MNTRKPNRVRCRRQRRVGLTLAEVVISTMMVGIVFVASLECLAAALRSGRLTSENAKARQMASQLLSEIIATEYREPLDAATFGRETGESGSERVAWDDVDDYHGWISNPPEQKSGAILANRIGWQREVLIELVSPTDPATLSISDQGVKRITVTVSLNGEVKCRRVGLRADR